MMRSNLDYSARFTQATGLLSRSVEVSYGLNILAALFLMIGMTAWCDPPVPSGEPFAPLDDQAMGRLPKKVESVPLTADALAWAKRKVEQRQGAAPPEGWDEFVLGMLKSWQPPNTYSDDTLRIHALPELEQELLAMPPEFVAAVFKRTTNSRLKSYARSWKESHPGEMPPAALADEVRSRARESIGSARDKRPSRRELLPIVGVSSLTGVALPFVTSALIFISDGEFAKAQFPTFQDLNVAARLAAGGLTLGVAMGLPLGWFILRSESKYHLLEAKAWRLLSHPSPPPDDCDFASLKK